MYIDADTERKLNNASRRQLSWLLAHRDTVQSVTISPFGSLHALTARQSFIIERNGRVSARRRGRPGQAPFVHFHLKESAQ